MKQTIKESLDLPAIIENEKDGQFMILIPAGEFIMGSDRWQETNITLMPSISAYILFASDNYYFLNRLECEPVLSKYKSLAVIR